MAEDILNRAIKFKEKLLNFIDLAADNKLNDSNYYAQERNFFVDNYFNQVPNFLKECRTLDDFINELKSVASGGGSWQARREFIHREFKEFLNFLEFSERSDYIELNIKNENINVILQKDIFIHIKDLLANEHYYNAVEESYKIVRNKLKKIVGKERAHEAFKEQNYSIIFGHEAKNEAEKDFFEGVKFLHMAIQYLRNEKAHTPAQKMDKNLAIHYIVLASLAYGLIDKKGK